MAILCNNKPHGISTHAAESNQIAFVEYLSIKLNKKLYVVHRLDKETSGVLLLADSVEDAASWSKKFENHEVSKEYLFITDQSCDKKNFVVKSYIEKQKNTFVSKLSEDTNSETEFKWIKSYSNFHLWSAYPKTGKSHQIRLHAEQSGIPILGDQEHNGSVFPRLCLHSYKLNDWKFDPPIFFENLELLCDIQLCSWLSAIDRRQRLFELTKTNSFRLIHNDVDNFKLDKFGNTLWGYWYNNQPPTPEELTKLKYISDYLKLPIYVRHMINRGSDPVSNVLVSINEPPKDWIAEELEVKYEARSNSGLSPGLFFDQRENREWVKNNSKNKKVLNLFSYTGLFSVNAALGRAAEVTTVDLSKNFIEWSKQNFKLNNLDPDKYEFWTQDVFLFIRGAIKRGRKWDLIICDPPSFARLEKGVFKIETDLRNLIMQLSECLNSNGSILVSSNYEKWTQSDFIKHTSLVDLKKYKTTSLLQTSFDYELSSERALKCALIHKLV